MVRAYAQIELPVATSRAREIFLDFHSWPQWTSGGPIRSVTPVIEPNSQTTLSSKSTSTILPSISSVTAPKGSKVRIDFGYSIVMTEQVAENNESEFRWRTQWPMGLMSAEHSFRFQPSKVTPGHTTFVNEEVFDGSLTWLVSKLTPDMKHEVKKEGEEGEERQRSPGFEGFNECFRQRVESLSMEK